MRAARDFGGTGEDDLATWYARDAELPKLPDMGTDLRERVGTNRNACRSGLL